VSGGAPSRASDLDIDLELLSKALELVGRGGSGPAYDPTSLLGSPTVVAEFISLDNPLQLDLETLASNLHFGWTDPIGELQQWIYDRLRELASWFSSIVDTIVSPIRSVVESIWSFLQGIPKAVTDAFRALADYVWTGIQVVGRGIMDSIDRLWSFLQGVGRVVADAVSGFFERLWDGIQSVGRGILDALGRLWDFLQGLGRVVADAVRGFFDWLWGNVQSAFKGLSDTLSALASRISDAFSGLLKSLSDAASSILSALSKVGETIGGALRSVADYLWSGIQSLGKGLVDALGRVWDFLQSMLRAVTDAVKGFADFLWSGIQSLGRGILDALGRVWDSIQGLGKVISDAVRGFAEWLWTGIQSVGRGILDALSRVWDFLRDLGSTLVSAVRGFAEWLWSGLQAVGRGILDALGRLWDFLRDLGRSIYDAVRGFAEWLWGGIQTVGRGLLDALGRVWEFLQGLGRTLLDAVKGSAEWLWGGVQSVGRMIYDALRSVADYLWGGLQALGRGVLDALGRTWELLQGLGRAVLDSVRGSAEWLWGNVQAAISGVVKFLEGLGSAIMTALTSAWDAVMSGLGTIGRALADVGERIWGFLVKMWTDLTGALVALGRALSDFAGYVYKFGAQVLGGIAAIGGFIQKVGEFLMGLPKILESMFRSVVDFFTKLGEQLASFFRDPAGWFRTHVIEPVWSGLLWLGGRLVDGLKVVWEAAVSGISWLSEQLGKVAGTMWSALTSAVTSMASALAAAAVKLAEAVSTVGETMVRFVLGTVERMVKEVPKALEPFTKRVLEAVWKDVGWGTPPGLTLERFVAAWLTSLEWFMILFLSLGWLVLPLEASSKGLAVVAGKLENILPRVTINLAPLGIGVRKTVELGKVLSPVLKGLSLSFSVMSRELLTSMVFGVGFWYSRFVTLLLSEQIRNFVPIEMPTVRETYDAFLRARVAEKVPPILGKGPADIVEAMLGFLRMRGYSDYLIAWSFAEPEDFYFEVEDRFGTKRKVPLADVWRIPPPSDVVRMMIRDIIVRPDQFIKVMRAVGYYDDVAAMYYVLHFRYPSPEKLADFYWRGVTGLLWLPETLEEPEIAKALRVATKASPPAKLNFNTEVLNRMMHRYWKWHDYAPFAWESGFPTDKSIVMELTADLPEKVDLRWFTRWGIFEHLSKLGVGLTTPVDEIVKAAQTAKGTETVSTKVSPGITLDVSMLARFLEARGVHPYLASLSAVAEVHVALTDEMTLLRTGFLELFRSGMVDLDATEHLMSGLFVIQFTTGYIDPATGKPVTYTYNKPVFWLPAERRLLQLRAAMDRAYELFRTMLREVASGVMRLGIKPEEARQIISTYASELLPVLSKHVKALTGVDWRPALDSEYVELWIRYAELTRAIEARTWIRHYATRVMAWLTYRMSYGWVDVGDFKALTEKLVAKGWLTEVEKEFFDTVMESIPGMVKREMIPTPLTLATMAEYMVVDRETVESVLRDHRVPEEYRPLYRKYIAVRPFKADFKTLVNRARRALVVGVLSKEEWESVVREAVERYGFREEEIEIQRRLAEVEERLEYARLWHPTPQTLATLLEYVAVPADLVTRVLAGYGIPKEWVDVWSRYVVARPLKPDYRSVLSAALRALRYGAITKDQWESILKNATQYGFTPAELTLLQLRAELELLIEEARLWRPSLLTLITISEYVPEAVKLLQLYPVDPAFRAVIERYALVKPLADEARVLVNALYRAKRYVTVPKELEDKVLSVVRQLGVTDAELAIRDLALELQVLVDETRVWLPTPTTLATLAEYVALPTKLVEEVLRARRVPEEWISVWLQYISVRPVKADYRSVLVSALRALRYGAITKEQWESILKAATQYGFTPIELTLLQLRAELELMVEEARLWRPSLLTLITISEYVPEAVKLLEYYKVDPVFRPIIERYAQVRPLADEVRVLVNALYRAKRYVAVPKELEDRVVSTAKSLGVTDAELAIRDLALELQVLADEARAWVPSPTAIATLSEYLVVPRELVEGALRARRIPEEWVGIWLQYITVRPLKSDYRAVISTALRALRYGAITKEQWDSILKSAANYGFTPIEVGLLQLRAELELMIEEARMWRPSLPTLISMIEYVPEAVKLLQLYPVDPAFRAVIERYATVRPLADDVRVLMSAYYRARRYAARYGQTIPDEVEKAVSEYLKLVGVTDTERAIRDLAEYLEVLVDSWRTGEVVPTLGALATMAEYVHVPADYVVRILQLRRVEPTYAQLWMQYVAARSVATEVGRVVSAFVQLYTRYAVPEELVRVVRELMARGGWTQDELQFFDLELSIRRYYRVLTLLVPTVRGFVADAAYLPNWEKVLEDLFRAYGLALEQYRAQLEYYRRLAKNRRLWRHFSWYRTQLTYAYQYGAIDERTVREALKKFVDIGLLDPEEVDIVVEGIKLRAAGYAAYRAARYR